MPGSPETDAALTGIQQALATKHVDPPVDVTQLGTSDTSGTYVAASTRVLLSGLSKDPLQWPADYLQLFFFNVPEYIAGEEDGVNELYDYLTKTYAACLPTGHEPMVVLAGYSQGSMVVQNVLNLLVANGQTGPAAMIKGAVLIADPERMRFSDVWSRGTAPASDFGICRALDDVPPPPGGSCVPPNPTTDVARYFAQITIAVCDAGDIVCDTSADLASNATTDIQDMMHGLWVHTNCHSYCGGLVEEAGRWVGFNLVADGLGTKPAPPISPTSTPTSSGGGAAEWAGVSAGADGAVCATRSDGTLWCWGDNNWGELGTGDTANTSTPGEVGIAADWATVSKTDASTCATRTDGTLWCWGNNNQGQLGVGDTNSHLTPTKVGTWTDWASVSAGANSTCAIRKAGTLWCWGSNTTGALGTGNTTSQLTPTQVGTETNWASVSVGSVSACATQTDGTLWCWGDNSDGQLGTGNTTGQLTPTQVGTAAGWSSVSAANGDRSSTCAIRTDGTLWCWGDNSDGQLGTGNNTSYLTPTRAGTGSDWATVSVGANGGDVLSTCATRTNGSLWCWGDNTWGQLGLGNTTGQLTPTQVGTETNWATVSMGPVSACATGTDGTLWCWGDNSDGQLGIGSTVSQLSPVRVG